MSAVLGGATAPFGAMFGVIFGIIIGLITSPAILLGTHRKPPAALLLIYGPTSFVSMLATATGNPGFVIFVAMLTLCLVSVCVRCWLPNRVPVREQGQIPCRQCGYDLRADPTGRCPECGSPPLDRVGSKHRGNVVALTVSLLLITGLLGTIAMRVVWRTQPAKTVDGLIRQLADNDMVVHDRAARELAKRGKEPLLRAMRDKNPSVRSRAIRGLMLLADPTTVPDLVEALGDVDPHARMWAALAIAKCGDETAICPLFDLLDDPLAGGSAEEALRALGVPDWAGPAEFGCQSAAIDQP